MSLLLLKNLPPQKETVEVSLEATSEIEDRVL